MTSDRGLTAEPAETAEKYSSALCALSAVHHGCLNIVQQSEVRRMHLLTSNLRGLHVSERRFAGAGNLDQPIRLTAAADELNRARKAARRLARRNGNGRVAGDVEWLRQSQHDIADWLARSVDLHRGGTDQRRRNRQGREHQGVVLRERGVHLA